MSSLPLISHHLFVAAIGHQTDLPVEVSSSQEPGNKSSAISLEVLDWSEPLPERAARILGDSASPGGV